MTSETASRHRLVRRLITEQRISSQQQLVTLLAAEGFAATQATVSRDLRALGARKGRDGQGERYEIAGGSGAGEPVLAGVVAEFVTAIVPTGSLVVLKTPPGAAQMVAGAVDGAGISDVAGTVAGDDTVLVVGAEGVQGRKLASRFEAG